MGCHSYSSICWACSLCMVHMLPTPWGPYLGLLHQRAGIIQTESPPEPKDHFLKQDLGDRLLGHLPRLGARVEQTPLSAH